MNIQKHLKFFPLQYDVSNLINICGEILMKTITESNCIEYLLIADMISSENLKNHIIEFMASIQKTLTKSEDWHEFSKTNSLLAIETLSYFLNNK